MALTITKTGSPSTITTGTMVLDASRENSELGGATVGPVRDVKMIARRKFLAPGTESMVRLGDSFLASEAEAKDLEARGFAGRAAIDPKAAKVPAAPQDDPMVKGIGSVPPQQSERGPGRPKAKK